LLASPLSLSAETAKATAPAKPVAPHSTFVMPGSPSEGHDPFFPESTRPYAEVAASTKPTIDSTAFTIKGMSIENGRPMIIINNHTFAQGDEGDVLIPNGRAHIHVIEIHGTTVTIEANGLRRDLNANIK